MRSPDKKTIPSKPRTSWLRLHLPTVPEALASLLSLVVVALFLNTFVLQPYLIPSESMEHTLLVGDFLLVNKQVYAPAGQPGSLSRLLMPYREVERGDIVVFHHALHPYLVKRVVGVPGDRLRIEDGRVIVNGQSLDEPYAAFEPSTPNPFRDDFPADVYSDPQVDLDWWGEMRNLTQHGELRSPAGRVFCARRQPQSQRRFPFLGICAAASHRGAGRWSFTSRSNAPPPPMCNKPRMIDSDTIENFPQDSRVLRAGNGFSS